MYISCDFKFCFFSVLSRSSVGGYQEDKTKTILTPVATQFVCHILSYFFLHASSVQRYYFFLTYANKSIDLWQTIGIYRKKADKSIQRSRSLEACFEKESL